MFSTYFVYTDLSCRVNILTCAGARACMRACACVRACVRARACMHALRMVFAHNIFAF